MGTGIEESDGFLANDDVVTVAACVPVLDEAEERVCAAEGQRESGRAGRAMLILGILEILESWEPVETVFAEEHVVDVEERVCAEEHVEDVEASAERVAALAD